MIYLEQTLNLLPAHPESLDKYVELAQKKLIPACERLGTRVIVAWFSHVEWFCQVTQIMDFNDLDALKKFRIEAGKDTDWGEYNAQLEEIAPERRSRLLEPLGPIPPETLNNAIEASKNAPIKVYGVATLEVNPDMMAQFKQGFELSIKNKTPTSDLIIASWRPIGGSPNEIIDLWKMYVPPQGYQPADDASKQFFRPLRQIAPKEHYIGVNILPYSELR